MKLTDARRRGIVAIAYVGAGRVSNQTIEHLGYVYWQTASWLLAQGLAYEPGGPPSIALTEAGRDLARRIGALR